MYTCTCFAKFFINILHSTCNYVCIIFSTNLLTEEAPVVNGINVIVMQ